MEPGVPTALGERFVLGRQIGAGTYGAVYEADDRVRGTRVALKLLRRAQPAALHQFKNEFRAVAGLVHPNLVALHELFVSDERSFFTMELVVGSDLLTACGASAPPLESTMASTDNGADPHAIAAPATPSTCDALRLATALRQIVDALATLHRAGKLHRDIKPNNIVMTPAGRAVVLDLGLVLELGRARDGAAPAGTPAYMSPEQAAGTALTPTTDWYSVGVMLYEALAGRLPFVGGPARMLTLKQTEDAPPLVGLSPETEALGRLCARLLRRVPEERPGADEIARALDEILTVPSPRPPEAGPIDQTPLVGRHRELALLREALAGEANPRVLVSGRSGVGKTRLCRTLIEELAAGDVVVLGGRCYESESVPYKALDPLIDGMVERLVALPADEVRRLLPPGASTLVRLFPVLGRVVPADDAAASEPAMPPAELRNRAVGALRELLGRLAGAAGLVLFVDDLQWSDHDSARMLIDLLGRPGPGRLSFVGCHRSEDAEASPLATLRTAWSNEGIIEVSVGPLTGADGVELARRLLGGSPEHAMHAPAIAAAAVGNPFFLQELAIHVTTLGGGGDLGNVTLDQLIHGSVRRLPARAERLLVAVSVAGHPIDESIAVRAAELGDGGRTELAALRAVGLLRTTAASRSGEDELDTYHDRVREAVIRMLDADRRIRAHARLAESLVASQDAEPEDIAFHLRGAGESSRAATFVELAAARAATALAFDRAAQLYGLALELRGADDAGRSRLLEQRAGALADAGRGQEAAEAFLAAAAGADGTAALDLRRRAAENLLKSGYVDAGLAALGPVLDDADLALASSPRGALLSLLVRRARLRLRGIRFRAQAADKIPAEQLARIDTCWSVAVGLSMIDHIRGADFQTKNLLLSLSAGEPGRVARALALEAIYAATDGGRSDRATRLIARTRAVAEQAGDRYALAMTAGAEGIVAHQSGDWPRARERLEVAAGAFRDECPGAAWEQASVQFFHLESLAYLGELATLADALPRRLAEAAARGDRYVANYLRTGTFSLIHLARDAPGTARHEADRAIADWSQQGFHIQHMCDLIARVHLCLYEGDGEGARRHLAERWSDLRRSLLLMAQNVLVEMLFLRGRSALAAATDAHPALLKEAERDASRLESERVTWALGLAALLRAGVASRRRQPEVAARWLTTAAAHLECAGMAMHLAVARRAHAALIGGTAGAETRRDVDAWMASQRIVAPDRFSALLAPGC